MPEDKDQEDAKLPVPMRVYVLLCSITSILALGTAVLRAKRPDLNIDETTIALLVLAVVPWIVPLLKSAKLPGGVELEFQQFRREVREGLEQSRKEVRDLASHIQHLSFHGATPDQEELIKAELTRFHSYLTGLGFQTPTDSPAVRVKPNIDTALFDPHTNTVLIDSKLVEDRDTLYHVYMHHVSISSAPKRPETWTTLSVTLQDALADYFACSYQGDPVFGKHYASVFGVEQGFLRDLANSYTFKKSRDDAVPPKRGEVWGGLFWDIRSLVGKDKADRMLAEAWMESAGISDEQAFIQSFVGSVLKQTEKSSLEAVKEAISRRGALRLSSGAELDLVEDV